MGEWASISGVGVQMRVADVDECQESIGHRIPFGVSVDASKHNNNGGWLPVQRTDQLYLPACVFNGIWIKMTLTGFTTPKNRGLYLVYSGYNISHGRFHYLPILSERKSA
jgi:hypothetical protein